MSPQNNKVKPLIAKRKSYKKRHSKEEWEERKPLIIAMRAQCCTRKDIVQALHDDGLTEATEHTLDSRIKDWGLREQDSTNDDHDMTAGIPQMSSSPSITFTSHSTGHSSLLDSPREQMANFSGYTSQETSLSTVNSLPSASFQDHDTKDLWKPKISETIGPRQKAHKTSRQTASQEHTVCGERQELQAGTFGSNERHHSKTEIRLEDDSGRSEIASPLHETSPWSALACRSIFPRECLVSDTTSQIYLPDFHSCRTPGRRARSPDSALCTIGTQHELAKLVEKNPSLESMASIHNRQLQIRKRYGGVPEQTVQMGAQLQ